MTRGVVFASTAFVAGALAIGSICVAGVAAAAPVCDGSIPGASSHAAFPTGRGPTGSAGCEDADDTGKMTNISTAGSFANANAVFTYAPQGTS